MTLCENAEDNRRVSHSAPGTGEVHVVFLGV
jgi:hypothetical protein